MKMFKKVLAAIIATAVVMSLAACGGSTKDVSTETTAASTAAAVSSAVADVSKAASNANVGVFYYAYSDTYISSVRTALDTQLKTLGVTYQDFDGNSNQTTQNEQIDTAISQGVTALIVNIVTAGSVDSSQALIDKAKAANIPIIFFNRAVAPDKEDKAVLGSYDKCAFVGTDAPEAGHMQGKLAGQYIADNFDKIDLNKDGKISYAMFKGQEGNVEAIYRTQFGLEDANAVLKEKGKPALVYFDKSNSDCYQVDQDGNWSATAANNYMVTNLAQYNKANNNMIEVVLCNNDGMAEGVISALNNAGYNLGTKDGVTIPVFGVDATDAAKSLISAGKMTGTIKQDADGMAACIAALTKNAANGAKLMDGTDSYNIAADVSNKIYIPYATYTGK
ncbi:MAG: galactose ABC transporter substrate-binding protein [Ruminiclostridium sp.]